MIRDRTTYVIRVERCTSMCWHAQARNGIGRLVFDCHRPSPWWARFALKRHLDRLGLSWKEER